MAHTSEATCRIRCSFKQATIVICGSNLVMVLYILQCMLVPLYLTSTISPPVYIRLADGTLLRTVSGHTQAQLKSVREANQARLAVKPLKLIERVKELQQEAVAQVVSDSHSTKDGQQTEVSKRITGLKFQGLDKWRREKLKQSKNREAAAAKAEVSSQSKDEVLLGEEVAPDEAVNSLDPEDGSGLLQDGAEIEDGIIPGRIVPDVCRAEAHTDYDGVAVRWGLTFHVESAADCCEACLKQALDAKGHEKKCNTWVYCPAEEGCFSPDIYEHKHQECWLKQADSPKINFKGHYDEGYRQQHPNAPHIVPWVSGVVKS